MRWFVILAVLAGCGRLGFDAESRASPDAGSSTVCPADTTETKAGSGVCIEKAQRGSESWTKSKMNCDAIGRRLCAAAEWVEGCSNAAGVTDMLDDFEWVAEEAGDIAEKRGAGSCDNESAHEIFIDAFGYRCCVDK